ncbi:metal ABC transporter permease [Agromyces seonyuensis]|uniref:Metal ABC transporter permease n=1 Tax=Agromyces seonyuensis TaxID=2662446 RepID=A0A6I4NVE9_9MICO|nr:metal ABC transporter permease [Agromyces seonyuensis]MWB98223.1 metal ABC transporter permease [Agromyces seonyuensis]
MGYFAQALLAAVLIGAGSGLVGTLVVLRRRTFFAQALTHATFPGAVAAAALGIAIPLGAAIAAVGIVAAMQALARIRSQGPDVAAGIVLTGGFALGVLLQALLPVPVHAESFLVGSILTVSTGDVWLAGALLVVAIAVFLLFGKEIAFSTFDPVGFRAAGYRARGIEVLVLALIATAVVSALPAVGAILAIALLAAPAAAAQRLMRTFRGVAIVAPLIGAGAGVLGVLCSRWFAIAAGPAIALIAAAVFAIALVVERARGSRRARASGIPDADRSTPSIRTPQEA